MELKNENVNAGCAIVIPTFNRPYYLKRILNYYSEYDAGKKYEIVVLDSSPSESKKQNKEIVRHFSDLDILYLDEYTVDIRPAWRKIFHAIDRIKSKYCVMCPDDDFITPRGIKCSVDFLEKNPDFTVAFGVYIGFWQTGRRGKETMSFSRPSAASSTSVTSEDPKERLKYHLSNYRPTCHGVHKRDFLKFIFEETDKFTDDVDFSELLPSMLSLIYGKMKELDILYIARDKNAVRCIQDALFIRDFVKDGTYDRKYARFKECLLRHLNKVSQIDTEEAEKIVDDAWSIYLVHVSKRPKKSFVKKTLKGKIKNVIDDLKLPDSVYESARLAYRKFFLSKEERMGNFEAFMRPEYYEDFNKLRDYLLTCPKNTKNSI